MGTGILVCGLNGTGKSTLGKALAEKLDFYFIDNEELYFPKTDPHYIYSSPRSRAEVEKLLLDKIHTHKNFVFTSVKGDYGDTIISFFQYAVWITVPREIRIQRVKNRSFQKFGNRILPDGDLYIQEERFFNFVKSRPENTVEEWIQSFHHPIIQVDGTKPMENNLNFILNKIKN